MLLLSEAGIPEGMIGISIPQHGSGGNSGRTIFGVIWSGYMIRYDSRRRKRIYRT